MAVGVHAASTCLPGARPPAPPRLPADADLRGVRPIIDEAEEVASLKQELGGAAAAGGDTEGVQEGEAEEEEGDEGEAEGEDVFGEYEEDPAQLEVLRGGGGGGPQGQGSAGLCVPAHSLEPASAARRRGQGMLGFGFLSGLMTAAAVT